MVRPKRPWSRTIEEAGISVRLFERAGVIYRDVRPPRERGADGQIEEPRRDKKSLGHGDRALAEEQARTLARRMSELRFAGQGSPVTLGQLIGLYERDRLPLLAVQRQNGVRGMLRLLERHFGRGYELDNLSQHAVDGYVRARLTGALVSPRHRTGKIGVGAGTLRNELHLLGTMITWGQAYKRNGRRLIVGDLMAGIVIPVEKNARRPVATEARYQALVAVADQADGTGRFRCVLAVARTTGRRIAAICALRRSDLLLTPEHIRRALATAGMDLAHAEHWPHGAILWGMASDKLGFESITPIGTAAREALEAYLRSRPSLGDAPLFPGLEDVTKPIGKEIAGYWLAKAERLAKLDHMERGGFHALRRLWASERRHLPAQDVAAAGGWRSLQVMRASYMHADAATVYSVVESHSGGPTQGPPNSQAVAAQQGTK